jgi:hypothetical protein
MDLAVFSPTELTFVHSALRAAACGGRPTTDSDHQFLAACETVLGRAEGASSDATFTPAAIAAGVRGAHQRKRLLQLSSVAALVHRPVRRESVEYVRALSKALQTRDPILPVLDALARGQRVRARLLSARRMFRVILKEAWHGEGVRGVLRFFGAMFLKFTVNKDRLWSYKRLGLLPEGTLGREFWQHVTQRGFGFPGERGGIPQVVAYHDVSHVLTGYSTEPEGEIQQGAFQAGCKREDGFVFLQFVLLQFHQGLKLTPIAKAETGRFDPHKVLGAVARGSRCPVDMTHAWDYWPLMPLPVDEARRRLNLLPGSPAPAPAEPTRSASTSRVARRLALQRL